MNLLEQKIREFACTKPEKIAVQGADMSLNYQQLITEIETVSSTLKISSLLSHCSDVTDKPDNVRCQSFALLMDNHPAWAVLDLALLFHKQQIVPLPKFFSVDQLKHALNDAETDYLIFDESEVTDKLINALEEFILSRDSLHIAQKHFKCIRFAKPSRSDTLSAAKITYTSGTTDKPKGVVLSEGAIISKVVSLATTTEACVKDNTLAILPLSTLLENIGGLYVPLYCGATVTILSPEHTGLSGSSQVNPQRLLAAIQNYRPTAFIIIPQLLLLLIKAVRDGQLLPDSIRFIAMGGAPISRHLLSMAGKLKIPVFEGYGLSEAASVVAVNSPAAHRPGSVGKVLASHQLQISEEGEILVKNNLFTGYLGQKNIDPERFYATGDIGKLDDDKFLYITGRKKNIINTAYGRNISPEWIEKELEAIPHIAQCVVYGHTKPYIVAILVPREGRQKLKSIQESINLMNTQLPDYARVIDFILTEQPFSVHNQQLTGTGRPRRSVIYHDYREQLEQCYINGETV